jgi:hypothetical protein
MKSTNTIIIIIISITLVLIGVFLFYHYNIKAVGESPLIGHDSLRESATYNQNAGGLFYGLGCQAQTFTLPGGDDFVLTKIMIDIQKGVGIGTIEIRHAADIVYNEQNQPMITQSVSGTIFNGKTYVIFNNPVIVRAYGEYAIVICPDATVSTYSNPWLTGWSTGNKYTRGSAYQKYSSGSDWISRF